MKKRNIKQALLQKGYLVLMIVLLLGVLAVREGSVVGFAVFPDDSNEPQTTQFTSEDVKFLYGDAADYQFRNDSIIVSSQARVIGWAINTSPRSDSIVGFVSSVPLLLGFNKNDELIGVRMLENYESPDFVSKIVESGFMKTWDGQHITEIANSDVDVVSGATLTSTAIIKTIQHSSGSMMNQSYPLQKPPDLMKTIKLIFGFLLLALALIQFFFTLKNKTLRSIFQIMIVVILGFWSGTFLSLFSMNNWLVHGIDLPARLFVFMVLILSVLLPLFTGKSFYCSHLCPFGASQDLMGKLNKQKIKPGPKSRKFLSTLREKIFAALMLLLFAGVSFDLTSIEPFSAFLFGTASIPVMMLALISLLLSVFIPRPWCKYACPTGYVLETIRKPFK